MKYNGTSLIRYPGGKQRLLNYILPLLPSRNQIEGDYVEPFVGSGAVFFGLNPRKAHLSDINPRLIDLYRGILYYPKKIWKIYENFPSTRKAYYEIRDSEAQKDDPAYGAARTLYLNRTCFKGMWRHNKRGKFNVGYGGQDRRWVISQESLEEVSRRLKNASLECCDFETTIDSCDKGDFIFADPPYRPGERELTYSHFAHGRFDFSDHCRLARALKRAAKREVEWALTISSHPDLIALYSDYPSDVLLMGTGANPGALTDSPREALIYNREEVFR